MFRGWRSGIAGLIGAMALAGSAAGQTPPRDFMDPGKLIDVPEFRATGGACEKKAGGLGAVVGVVYRVGADVDLSDTPAMRKRIQEQIWPAMAARCEGLEFLRIVNSTAAKDWTPQTYVQPVYLNRMIVSRDADGSFRFYMRPSAFRSAAHLRKWKDEAPEEDQVAALYEDEVEVVGDKELWLYPRDKNTKMYAPAVRKLIQGVSRIPFTPASTPTSTPVAKLVFQGTDMPDRESTNFRAAMFAFLFEKSRVCTTELKGATTLILYDRIYSGTTTTYRTPFGNTWDDYNATWIGVKAGLKFKVDAAWEVVLRKYFNVKDYPDGPGTTWPELWPPQPAFQPDTINSSYSQATREMKTLFEAYGCNASEIRVMDENLHRIVDMRRGLQKDVIYETALRNQRTGLAVPASFSEADIIRDFLAARPAR